MNNVSYMAFITTIFSCFFLTTSGVQQQGHQLQPFPDAADWDSNYSWASIEPMPGDWAKLCLSVKLPYSHYRIN